MGIQYIISQSKAERKRFRQFRMPRACCVTFFFLLVEFKKRHAAGLGWVRVGWERFKKSAVIDYFAGKVSQITRPFILKTMTMQTLIS